MAVRPLQTFLSEGTPFANYETASSEKGISGWSYVESANLMRPAQASRKGQRPSPVWCWAAQVRRHPREFSMQNAERRMQNQKMDWSLILHSAFRTLH